MSTVSQSVELELDKELSPSGQEAHQQTQLHISVGQIIK